ncbi:PDZ domain-containing protein [Streptomyces sp. NPDC046197]|uniref:PDZ domain-containing protein n=1 Tax=Streptomyces sp. NPDC046197 TaxID=3154337 RepID=UPI003400110A
MEQSALRAKPMPGQKTGAGSRGSARHPHAARRRGRRLTTLLLGLFIGAVLVLSGVGLGTVGATLIGMSKLAELQRQTGRPGMSPEPRSGPARTGAPATTASPSPAPVRMTLGIEVADYDKPGALVVGVHVPGPGYTAGLVRGDVLLAFGRTRIDSAADLARAVARARPGRAVVLTLRHGSGGYRQLGVVPGVVT